MSKVVVNSSVIIALSTLGYLNKLKLIFPDILVAKVVFEEICSAGQGLVGERGLQEAVKDRIIRVKEVKTPLIVNALLDPLAIGEAETIAIASEEKATYVILDDKAARRRAKTMKLSVVGTLRILRLMYEDKIIDKSDFINALKKLRETGFRISDSVIDKAIQGLQ